MRIVLATAVGLWLATLGAPCFGQGGPPAPNAAALRQEAAQLAELRRLLLDADPNVRLLAMREMLRSDDVNQREIAIDAGLSTADAAMVEAALRAMLAHTRFITIALAEPEQEESASPAKARSAPASSTLLLPVASFDPQTGIIAGVIAANRWEGQLQGTKLTLRVVSSFIELAWDDAAREFRGMLRKGGGARQTSQPASWRPR